MRFFTIILAASLLSHLFAAETEAVYEDLSSSQEESLSFIPTDFWASIAWKQLQETDERLLQSPIFSIIEKNYCAFCERTSHSPTTDFPVPPKGTKIPPKIHFVWLGSDLPLSAQRSIQSWQIHHPGWEIQVWGDVEAEKFEWSNKRSKETFQHATSFAEKSDILRYEILYQYGGIYSDTDVICVRPFHDLLMQNLEFFAGVEVNLVSSVTKNPLHLGTAIIGAAKNSAVLKCCIDNQLGAHEAPNVHILNRTGPGMFTRACSSILFSEASNENFLLLPISYFYPFPWEHHLLPLDRVQNYIRHESMAVHLWNGSWLTEEERMYCKKILELKNNP